MNDSDKISVSFKIKGIEILDSALFNSDFERKDDTLFLYDINIVQKLNLDKNLLIVVSSITILDKNTEKKLGHFKASCIYFIESLESFFDTLNKKLNLPSQLIITLNSISISTTRGLMFSFFRGTLLHDAVLPIIDPNTFSMDQ